MQRQRALAEQRAGQRRAEFEAALTQQQDDFLAEQARLRAAQAPFESLGAPAASQLQALLTGQAGVTPLGQAQIDAGTQAVEASAAARGGLLSGDTARSLQELGQQVAAQDQARQFQQALQVAGFARTSANTSLGPLDQALNIRAALLGQEAGQAASLTPLLAQVGSNFVGQNAVIQGQIGQAQAQAAVAGPNAFNSTLGNLTSLGVLGAGGFFNGRR